MSVSAMLEAMGTPRNKTSGSKTDYSSLRVIAGKWRGRKLTFLVDGVRPTSDRVRETLFNWLVPNLQEARCLDLFAGSGALGIEALSRGAKKVVFVERNARMAKCIQEQLEQLHAVGAEVLTANAFSLNLAGHGGFDIVFLDPPFDGPDLADLCTLLEASGSLADSCRVYMEMHRGQSLPEVPANWSIQREKTAGQVRYALAHRTGSQTEE
jgi:16S rRNA (guanine966-N2)-methyltransferase